MRGRTITGLLVGALMVVGCAATSAASAAKLTLSEGGVTLAPGFLFEFSGVRNFSVETPDGEVECTHPSTLQVETLTNSKATDELGSLEVVVNGGNHCESPLGNVFPGLAGERLLVPATGRATIKSATLFLIFERGDKECFYPTKALKGENSATPTRGPFSLLFDQRLRRDKSSSPGCPKEAALNFELPEALGQEGGEERVEQQTS